MNEMPPDNNPVREASALLREDLLKIFRAGAISAAIFAVVIGFGEFFFFGFEYWGSLLTSFGTGSMAALFFWLSSRGKAEAASWVLVLGIWSMIMIDTAVQQGSATQSVVVLPLIILVAVWLFGSRWLTYLLAGASTLILLGIELAIMNGLFEPKGVSSPMVGIMVVALILFLSGYVSLSIYASHMTRLQEQHALAESLAQSEHEYRMIVDNSTDPHYRANLEGIVIGISPSIEKMSGYSTDDILGNKLSSFYADPADRDEFLRQLQESGGELSNFETQLLHKSGHSFWVSTSAHYWRDKDGNILGVEGTVRDISEWKRLQEKVIGAGRVEMLDQLSGGLAHNFNNLLAIVQGNAELIASADDPDEIKRLANIIIQASDRGVDLTRRMISISSHGVADEVEAIDVNEIIRDIQPIVETSLSRGIQFDLDIGHDVWCTESNVGEFEDAVINLTLNARDAITGPGTITIVTRNVTVNDDYVATNPQFRRGDCVAVEVHDDGVGIKPSLIHKLIEPFFTTKSKEAGTGLGLSMIYGFLRRAGGDIEITSQVGEGTCVTMYLPRASSEALAKRERASQSHTKQIARERVLVVEDEAPLRELNEKRLRLLGYSTLAVESGVEASEVLRSDEPIDIVFSDIVMPGGISGYDLVHIVRDLRPGTPIILCTGYAEENPNSLAREPFKILRKPFSNEDLAEAIRDELEAAKAGQI